MKHDGQELPGSMQRGDAGQYVVQLASFHTSPVSGPAMLTTVISEGKNAAGKSWTAVSDYRNEATRLLTCGSDDTDMREPFVWVLKVSAQTSLPSVGVTSHAALVSDHFGISTEERLERKFAESRLERIMDALVCGADRVQEKDNAITVANTVSFTPDSDGVTGTFEVVEEDSVPFSGASKQRIYGETNAGHFEACCIIKLPPDAKVATDACECNDDSEKECTCAIRCARCREYHNQLPLFKNRTVGIHPITNC